MPSTQVNRVIRACVELGKEGNPIISIHDQGAGGNCNVLKEIVSPAGGKVNIRAIITGDDTLSVLELWGAEYQEADALLLRRQHRDMFAALCARERVPVAFVGKLTLFLLSNFTSCWSAGEVTNTGRMVVYDPEAEARNSHPTPVDIDLEKVLGNMPRKTFNVTRGKVSQVPFEVPTEATVSSALDRVLRLLSVGSKRFLTNKVDRSVTGLVAAQQCVGPLHTPVADCAVLALSYTDKVGTATSIGEQPIKGLASPAAMARMAVGEAVTNLMGESR